MFIENPQLSVFAKSRLQMGYAASGFGDPCEADLGVHGHHVYPELFKSLVIFLALESLSIIVDVFQMGEAASGYGSPHNPGGADLGVYDGGCPRRLGLLPTLQVCTVVYIRKILWSQLGEVEDIVSRSKWLLGMFFLTLKIPTCRR